MMNWTFPFLSRPMDSRVCASRPCMRSTTKMAMSHMEEPRVRRLLGEEQKEGRSHTILYTHHTLHTAQISHHHITHTTHHTGVTPGIACNRISAPMTTHRRAGTVQTLTDLMLYKQLMQSIQITLVNSPFKKKGEKLFY